MPSRADLVKMPERFPSKAYKFFRIQGCGRVSDFCSSQLDCSIDPILKNTGNFVFCWISFSCLQKKGNSDWERVKWRKLI